MTPAELRAARRALGLSQAEFARALGFDAADEGDLANAISRLELGKRGVSGPLARLVSLLDLPQVRRRLGIAQ